MKRIRKPNLNWKDNKFIWLSFLITAAMVLFVYLLKEVFPFGTQTILKVDLYHQYAPFHEELRSRILNGQSLFYSWEGGLGKEMYTQIAYYTTSPLAILMLLFSVDSLPEAMAILILLKIALSSASFSLYLKKTFRRNDWTLTAFGLLYGSCAFLTAFSWNIMWLDAVALFPLLALGIERLVRENKAGTYLAALAVIIFVNFYIAFIMCIMSVLYFGVTLLIRWRLRKDWRMVWRRVLKFGLASLLGGGISMVLIIPTAISLGQTAVSDVSFPKFELYNNVYQLLSNHFLGARPVVLGRNEDLPNLYSGVLTMLLLPFYYMDRHYKRKEKIWYSIFLLLLLAASSFRQLDFLIHGAHFPANLPHRYTFVYSFLLIMLAYKGFLHWREVKFRRIIPVCLAYAAIVGISEFVIVPRVDGIARVYSNPDLILNVVMMAGLSVVLYWLYKGKQSKWAVRGLFLLLIAECTFSQYNGLGRTTTRSRYVQYNHGTEMALDYMEEEQDGAFYRTEFRRFTIINEGSYHHFNGFSQFSSLAPGGISSLIGQLGIASSGNSYRYYDATPLIDAMFSIRYMMDKSADEAEEKEYAWKEWKARFDNVAVYENERVLPLAYMTDRDILDWDVSEDSPFHVQNDFLCKAAGIREEMFVDVPLAETEGEAVKLTKRTDNSYSYKVLNPANLSAVPSFTAVIRSDREQYLYLYVDVPNTKNAVISRGGSEEKRELTTGNSMLDIGWVSEGEEITISFELTNRGEFETSYRGSGTVKLYAAGYEDAVFQKGYDILSSRGYQITSWDDTRIEGTVQAEETGILMTSIPYIKGWTALVDGTRQEVIPLGEDGLLGVEIQPGEHTVEFVFRVPGFALGSILSLICLAGSALLIWKEKKAGREDDVISQKEGETADEEGDEEELC